MKHRNIIWSLLLMLPLSCVAQSDNLFHKLQQSLNNYAKKIEKCDAIRDGNSINLIEIQSVHEVLIKHPSVLSFLSARAYSNCLQPERGLLAEAILISLDSNDASPSFKLADSTRKMVFHYDSQDEANFNKLRQDDKDTLLSINSFKQPFSAIELMDELIISQ